MHSWDLGEDDVLRTEGEVEMVIWAWCAGLGVMVQVVFLLTRW